MNGWDFRKEKDDDGEKKVKEEEETMKLKKNLKKLSECVEMIHTQTLYILNGN